MNNKKLGNSFEIEFCEILFNEGFWVHKMTQNASGQPADVIAARNGKTYLIDCKVCSQKRFSLSRMEENQDLSMELWKACGNGEGWFAVLVQEQIVMLPHFIIKALRNRQQYINECEIREYGIPFGQWLQRQ